MPQGTAFDRGFSQMWRPLAFKPSERTRNFHWMQALERLKPGVTIEQARAQMDAIGARIATDYPDSNKGWGVTIERYADVLVGPQLRSSLYVLLDAVGMLLLIGCVNLANLTLARGTSRDREVAVRAALGAGRWRLLQQFLTENVLLWTTGGALGLLAGYAMMNGLKLIVPPFTLVPRARRATQARPVLQDRSVLQGLQGPMGPQGPGGPQGPIGPQGPGLPSGAVIFVLEGTPCPAGYTMIGTMSADLKPASGGGTSHVRLYVLRKD